MTHPMLEEDQNFSSELKTALTLGGRFSGEFEVISRKQNPYSSTFPSEIITCRMGKRQDVEFLFKHAKERKNKAFGHRGGVKYEAKVYQRVLQKLALPSPLFYGIYRELSSGRTALIIQFISGSARVNESHDSDAMKKAAGWIGQFHSHCDALVSEPSLSFLQSYDAAYYSGWARRAREINIAPDKSNDWLDIVCGRFNKVIEILCQSTPTIIHGEYYPNNILYKDGLVYPVDWESTAIGCGEIDLVSLTDKWDTETRKALETEYQKARWPRGTPRSFEKTLCAARIYMQLRWLGENPEWAPYLDQRLHSLKNEAQQFGLI